VSLEQRDPSNRALDLNDSSIQPSAMEESLTV
jgi:hypothetical protein